MKASDLLIASFADLRAAEEYLSKAIKDQDPERKTTRNETTTQTTKPAYNNHKQTVAEYFSEEPMPGAFVQ